MPIIIFWKIMKIADAVNKGNNKLTEHKFDVICLFVGV